MIKGFSLMELLIVLVIMGVLSLFAYPNYNDYIMRAHRSDGQVALFDLANRMEQYYFERNTYHTATIGGGSTFDVLSNNTSPDGWYKLSINASASAYTLQATPTGSQASRDSRCQSLTLTNLGKKAIAIGPAGTPTGPAAECW